MRTHAALWALTGLATTSILLFTVAWADEGPESNGARPAPVRQAGADLFRQNCQACHGAGAVGSSTAPRLLGVLDRLSQGEARTVIEHGRNNMPSFRHLERAEVDALLAYLGGGSEKEGAIPAPQVTLPSLTRVQIGERIFKSNCASCHSGASARGWCGPPSLVNVTRRLGAEQIAGIVRRGSCRMPSFDHFTDGEISALHAYLATLAQDDAPIGGRGCCGSGCGARRSMHAPRAKEESVTPQPKPAEPARPVRRRGGCCG